MKVETNVSEVFVVFEVFVVVDVAFWVGEDGFIASDLQFEAKAFDAVEFLDVAKFYEDFVFVQGE